MYPFSSQYPPKANPVPQVAGEVANPAGRGLVFRPYSKAEQTGKQNPLDPSEKMTGRSPLARRTKIKNKNSRKGPVQKRMKAYRVKTKWCERCLADGKFVLADDTHHIDKVGMGGASPDHPLHQEMNFAAVCKPCHDWADSYAESVEFFKSIKPSYWENLAKAMSLTKVESRFAPDKIKDHQENLTRRT